MEIRVTPFRIGDGGFEERPSDTRSRLPICVRGINPLCRAAARVNQGLSEIFFLESLN